MKKIDVTNMLTLLANLAVVAGIAFLVVQIREERNYAIVENTILVGQSLAEWHDAIAHDPDRSSILMRGSQDFASLTPGEQYEFDLLMRSLIIRIEVGRIARARSVAPEGSGPGGESLFLTGVYRRLLDLPGTRAWWASADKRGLQRGAVAYIDDYIAQQGSGASPAN